jgi:hypothetical protein
MELLPSAELLLLLFLLYRMCVGGGMLISCLISCLQHSLLLPLQVHRMCGGGGGVMMMSRLRRVLLLLLLLHRHLLCGGG